MDAGLAGVTSLFSRGIVPAKLAKHWRVLEPALGLLQEVYPAQHQVEAGVSRSLRLPSRRTVQAKQGRLRRALRSRAGAAHDHHAVTAEKTGISASPGQERSAGGRPRRMWVSMLKGRRLA